jgi:hypothetical protein
MDRKSVGNTQGPTTPVTINDREAHGRMCCFQKSKNALITRRSPSLIMRNTFFAHCLRFRALFEPSDANPPVELRLCSVSCLRKSVDLVC